MQAVRDPRYNGNAVGHDVGVLRLATPITDIPPVPINTTPLVAGDISKMLRHIGYGVTDGRAQTGFGTKRQVLLPIRQVNAPGAGVGRCGQADLQRRLGRPCGDGDGREHGGAGDWDHFVRE